MIKLDLDASAQLPLDSIVVDDSGLMVASNSIQARHKIWVDHRKRGEYVLGYMRSVVGYMQPETFRLNPEVGYHMVIATAPRNVSIDPRRINSVENNFDEDILGWREEDLSSDPN